MDFIVRLRGIASQGLFGSLPALLIARAILCLLSVLGWTIATQGQELWQANLERDFPEVATSIAKRDSVGLETAFSKLDLPSKQRVLTVLHSQRISRAASGTAGPSGSASRDQQFRFSESTSGSGSASELRGQQGFNRQDGAQGAAGGASMANFTELMRLIESTITPDIWLNAGGTATMSPFRQGVRINPEGVIERIETSKQTGAPKLRFPPGDLAKGSARGAPAVVGLDDLGEWQTPSKLRWISLRNLDDQLAAQREEGGNSSIASEILGGLCRIDYLAWDPQLKDWWVGGPAGNLAATAQGDLIHRELRLPPVLLEDVLCVAQHVFAKGGEFGCSIDPDPQRLVAAYQMANQKSSMRLLAKDPEAWSEQWKEKLGYQKATIVGIDRDSPTGYALLIADAHMKRLAFGLEPSVDGLANYWIESDRLGHAKEQSMVRWWFSMSKEPIPFDPETQVYEFKRSNVEVLSETQRMNAAGERTVAAFPDRAADAYARNFTTKFEQLQQAYPAYGRLRHIFDLAVVMEIIRSHGESGRNEGAASGASPGGGIGYRILGNPEVVPHLVTAPTQIESVVATRKRSDGTISAIVSGGVSIEPRMVRGKLRLDTSLSDRVVFGSSPGEGGESTNSDRNETSNGTIGVMGFEPRFWR